MDIRQMRYFIALAESLSFSAAAKSLQITQPALSKQIADLEDEIGVKLVSRNTRSVELTAAGASLLTDAAAIVADSDDAINQSRLAAQGYNGRLVIGFLGPLESEGLPELIRSFRSRCPHTDVSFLKLGWGPLNEALENSHLDIAFTMSSGLNELPGISWRLSHYSYPLSVVAPKEHRLSQKNTVPISDLSQESFVVLSRTESPLAYNHMRQMCLANGFQPNIRGYAPNLETLFLMVAAGLGIAIQTKHTRAYAGPYLSFIDLSGSSFVHGYAVAWKTTNPNPLIPLFLEILKEEKFLIC